MIKEPLCRNYDIHIYLARCYNRALCFGIGEGSRLGALCIGIIGYGVRYKAEERGVAGPSYARRMEGGVAGLR